MSAGCRSSVAVTHRILPRSAQSAAWRRSAARAPWRAAAVQRWTCAPAGSAETPPLSLGLQDAALRAQESLRPDKLFDDPWAAVVLGDAGHSTVLTSTDPAPPSLGSAASSAADADAAAVSTRVLDAALLNAVEASGEEVRQVVFVGHGCDTRPFRMQWPTSTRLFELGSFDSIAHAEIAFERAGMKHPKGCLLKRLAADVSGPQAKGTGWLPSLESAGYMAERPSAWSIQGGHLLTRAGLEALLIEIGDGAATGSALVGEVGASYEGSIGGALAVAGFGLMAWEPLGLVAERLGRPLSAGPAAADRGFFLAKKARLSQKQEETIREEIYRAEQDSGEEGFSDAP